MGTAAAAGPAASITISRTPVTRWMSRMVSASQADSEWLPRCRA